MTKNDLDKTESTHYAPQQIEEKITPQNTYQESDGNENNSGIKISDIGLIGIGLLQFIIFAWQGWQLKKTVAEMKKSSELSIGRFAIDFANSNPIEIQPIENGMFRFRINASVINTGGFPIRIISLQFQAMKMDFWKIFEKFPHIQNYEITTHKIVKALEKIPFLIITNEIYSSEQIERIRKYNAPPILENETICFYGKVKYSNGFGETWIQPFFFHFQWNEFGNAIAMPIHNNCQPEKKYPTRRTDIYDFFREKPKIWPIYEIICKIFPLIDPRRRR